MTDTDTRIAEATEQFIKKNVIPLQKLFLDPQGKKLLHALLNSAITHGYVLGHAAATAKAIETINNIQGK